MKIFQKKEDIISKCATSNSSGYNFDKLVEEMAEFQEAVVKQRTKHPNNPSKPPKKHMIKEFGDLIYRGVIYLHQEFGDLELSDLMKKIEERIEQKLEDLEKVKNTQKGHL